MLSRKILFLVMVLALGLRLVAIDQSLWLDEAIGAIVVKEFSYKQILTDFLRSDNHPPLYYLDLKGWTDIFGYSELALRFPSVVYGVLTVYLTYLIAVKLSLVKEKYFPFIATILMATSPFHIYYSQEARMYSMAAFLASLSFYSFLNINGKKGKLNWWYVFSVSITALVFTDYPLVFLLPVFWIYGIYKRKDIIWWKKFILSHIPIVLLGLAWLPTLIVQLGKGRWLMEVLPEWKKVAGGANLKQVILVWMKFVLGRISLTNKVYYYAMVVVASVPFMFSLAKTYFTKEKPKDLWIWFCIPLILGFLASFYAPIFIYFRFLYVLPAFYLLIARGASLYKIKIKIIVITTAIMAVNLTGWGVYVLDKNQQRENWRGATLFVEGKMKENEIAIFEYPEPFAPYIWYRTKPLQSVGVTDSISANKKETIKRTEKTIEGKSGIYYFEYLRDLSDPERFVEGLLEKEGYVVLEIFDFVGVGQIFYYTQDEK